MATRALARVMEQVRMVDLVEVQVMAMVRVTMMVLVRLGNRSVSCIKALS